MACGALVISCGIEVINLFLKERMVLGAGDREEASFIATDGDMAKALAASTDDDFPEVFATSRMIALMELAGARLMKRIVGPGQLSVGVGVFIKHLAATPNNTRVTAVATFLELEGKLYKFKVEAFDAAGKIGEGEHTRAIIDSERLLSGAAKRLANAR